MTHGAQVVKFQFEPEGVMRTFTGDGSIRQWNLRFGSSRGARIGDSRAQVLAVGSDGRALVVQPGGNLTLMKGQSALRSLAVDLHGAPAASVDWANLGDFSADGRHVTFISSKAAEIFDAEGLGLEVNAIQPFEGAEYATKAFSQCGRFLGIVNNDRRPHHTYEEDGETIVVGQDYLRVWNLGGEGQTDLKVSIPEDVQCVSISSGARRIAMGTETGGIFSDRQADGEYVSKTARGRSTRGGSVAINDDGSRVILGGKSGIAQEWDFATGKPFPRQLPHPGPVVACSYGTKGTPSERLAITAAKLGGHYSDRYSIHVWDLDGGVMLGPAVRFRAPTLRGEKLWDRIYYEQIRVRLSPDGARGYAVGGMKAIHFEIAPPLPEPAPAWFLDFCEVLGGARLSEQGSLELVGDAEWFETRDRLQAQLQTPESEFERWVMWLLKDPASRGAPSAPNTAISRREDPGP